ncbi:hypothetical protein ACP4OV_019666 [Aristida adscensionis]
MKQVSGDDGIFLASNTQAPNLDLDFFSEAPANITAASSSAGGRGGAPRRQSTELDGLDLNSQALDLDDDSSFLDLLRSSPAALPREEDRGVAGYGTRRESPRGTGHGADRGGSGVRGSVQVAVPSRSKLPAQDIDFPSRTAAGGRGRAAGRGSAARPPVPPTSRQFRAPRPAGRRGKSMSATANAFDDSVGGGVHDPAASTWGENRDDDLQEEVHEQHELRDAVFDKADWTNSMNNAAFCEICVEEIRAGNRNNGYLTRTGYKNIAQKFEQRTGLRHSRLQFKNRWDALKRLYVFWKSMNKQTGLGRANGTVMADDDWWKTHTENHAEWRKLRYGPPENLNELQVMFDNIAVDGSTSCIPGEIMRDGNEGEVDDGSPMSVKSGKRTMCEPTKSQTATSPKKRTRSPMVKVMKGIWETMQATSSTAQKALQGDFTTEAIKEVMRLVVECGATEGTDEHFMATKLLVKAEHRTMFLTLTTKEGRLDWLRRWCKENTSK